MTLRTPQPPRRARRSSQSQLLPRDPVRLAPLEAPFDLRRDLSHYRADIVGAARDRFADHLPDLVLGELGRKVGAQQLRLLLLLLREVDPPAGAHLLGGLATPLDRARDDRDRLVVRQLVPDLDLPVANLGERRR